VAPSAIFWSMDYAIRTMSRAEVELALDWAAAEGWNPGQTDATPFHVADPAGFLIVLVDGAPAAIISVVRYDHTFGFLGLYIIAPHHRGRGHGLRLWEAGLAHLGGCVVGLDGVVAQQDNYRRSGFDYGWPKFRFGGRIEARPTSGLVDAREVPFGEILRLDRALFPAPRAAFLAAWLAMPESRTLALVADGRLAALGRIRRCREGCKIGPLYAPAAPAAERILRALAAHAPGEETFLDVPGPNMAAMRLARELGLKQRFETARMYKGGAPSLPLEQIFGIATFELG
jgi:hypothetical protein